MTKSNKEEIKGIDIIQGVGDAVKIAIDLKSKPIEVIPTTKVGEDATATVKTKLDPVIKTPSKTGEDIYLDALQGRKAMVMNKLKDQVLEKTFKAAGIEADTKIPESEELEELLKLKELLHVERNITIRSLETLRSVKEFLDRSGCSIHDISVVDSQENIKLLYADEELDGPLSQLSMDVPNPEEKQADLNNIIDETKAKILTETYDNLKNQLTEKENEDMTNSTMQEANIEEIKEEVRYKGLGTIESLVNIDEQIETLTNEMLEAITTSVEAKLINIVQEPKIIRVSNRKQLNPDNIIASNVFASVQDLIDTITEFESNIPDLNNIRFKSEPDTIIEDIAFRVIDIIKGMRQLYIIEDELIYELCEDIKYIDEYIYTLVSNEEGLSYIVFKDLIYTIGKFFKPSNMNPENILTLTKDMTTIRTTLATVDAINELINYFELDVYKPSGFSARTKPVYNPEPNQSKIDNALRSFLSSEFGDTDGDDCTCCDKEKSDKEVIDLIQPSESTPIVEQDRFITTPEDFDRDLHDFFSEAEEKLKKSNKYELAKKLINDIEIWGDVNILLHDFDQEFSFTKTESEEGTIIEVFFNLEA